MTRILDIGNEENYDTTRTTRNTVMVYKRLVGYAFRYKLRLAISVLFALVVALSFTSMIFAAGGALTILNDPPDKVDEQIAGIKDHIAAFSASMDSLIGWAPSDLGTRFETWAQGLQTDRGHTLTVLCVTLILLSAVGGGARFLQEYFAGNIGARISIQLNTEMFNNVLGLSHRFYEKKTTGEVVARFTNDAFMVNKGIANVFVKLIREPIKALFCFLGALAIDPFLTLIIMLVLPPVATVLFSIGKRMKKSVRRSLEKVATMAAILTETVSGVSVIKSFLMEPYERMRMDRELSKLRKHLIRMVRADAAVGPITEFIMILGLVTFIVLSERQLSSGNLTGSQLIILFGLLAAMLDPMRKLATVNNLVQTSVASAERVFEFIDAEASITNRASANDITPLKDALAFEDVHFSYDGETTVLHGVSFRIRQGEMVALVGFSGSGKSTIAKLIPRFYDVSQGRIAIDGEDIRDATLNSLRGQISIVTQDTILFHESVKGNICFGRDDFEEERIHEAARAAHADSFIEALPQGYDTILDESGGNLSGGQRQRIAIARAIIKDPAILILDEATSSLDSESETAIQQALDVFVAGRTTLVIAHRLSTVQRADRVIVIDEGRIVEEGTHEELLANGGIFQRLYELQFRPPPEA